jgi:hypothetical protein
VAKRQLGRLVLRADAAYCALAAGCLAAFTEPLAGVFDVPAIAVLGVSGATAGWALVLLFAARRENLKGWLLAVLIANAVAVGLLIALAAAQRTNAMTLLLVAVAVEVAAFAVAQAVALSSGTLGGLGHR